MSAYDPKRTFMKDLARGGYFGRNYIAKRSLALWRVAMSRNVASTQAAQYGTSEEAKAMLDRAIAAVKENKAKALDMFNKGEGGFKDRDLYVYCANASDGIFTAHPTLKGKQLRDIKGKHGAPLGETIMENATEGTIKETTYWWPRPGSDKAGDQICAVGYYKE